MLCLYCNEKLGLFASRKRPFCSEVHGDAYHAEQSMVALRRVLDPLFAAPIKPPQLRLTPEQEPPAEGDFEIVPLPAPVQVLT